MTVPTGTHLLSDAIVSSPILAGEDGIPGGFGGGEEAGGGGGGDHNEFGVDPNLDPELALVRPSTHRRGSSDRSLFRLSACLSRKSKHG